jgi:hypothetical protein
MYNINGLYIIHRVFSLVRADATVGIVLPHGDFAVFVGVARALAVVFADNVVHDDLILQVLGLFDVADRTWIPSHVKGIIVIRHLTLFF